MASKKKAAAPSLYLHCKCNQCTAWELVFKNGDYYLVCASCPEEIKLYGLDFAGGPVPSIHWEAKK